MSSAQGRTVLSFLQWDEAVRRERLVERVGSELIISESRQPIGPAAGELVGEALATRAEVFVNYQALVRIHVSQAGVLAVLQLAADEADVFADMVREAAASARARSRAGAEIG